MTRPCLALAVLLLLPVPAAYAQTASRFFAGADVGVARTWDDESFIGTGLLTGVRAGIDLTSKTSLDLSLTRIPHDRDFETSPVSVTGRSLYTGLTLKHDFTRGAVRPFVLAGYGLNQHSRTWTDATSVHEFSGFSHGYNAGVGAAVRRGRWEHGVEARAHMLAIDDDSAAAMILTGAYRVTRRF